MGRPAIFDLEDLAGAGLRLVEHEGWSAVSVRGVAQELGVSPMALYRAVSDAQELRRVIADAAAQPLRPKIGSRLLIPTLRVWASDAYEHLGRYPELASFVIVEWTELPSWLDIVEVFLAGAAAQGLTGPPAVGTVNAVFAYVLARAQLRDSAAAAPRRHLGPVRHDPGRYPMMRRNLAEFTTAKTEIHFQLGLDALTDGLHQANHRPLR